MLWSMLNVARKNNKAIRAMLSPQAKLERMIESSTKMSKCN